MRWYLKLSPTNWIQRGALPSKVLPSSKKSFTVHVRCLKEFIDSQRKFEIQFLLHIIVNEANDQTGVFY